MRNISDFFLTPLRSKPWSGNGTRRQYSAGRLFLRFVQSPSFVATSFVVLACILIITLKFDFLFVNPITIERGDLASDDMLILDAKHFALLHGQYSKYNFYHPGPFFLQWMAMFEILFLDMFKAFASPHATHAFAAAFLQILAYALYFRLWQLWFGKIWVAAVSGLVTFAVTSAGVNSDTGFILFPWTTLMLLASALMTVTGFVGLIVRGPTWLPLVVFGLGQLLHGHASFIGLIPIMLVVAVATAIAFGRFSLNSLSFNQVRAFAALNRGPLTYSVAILLLFLLPIGLQTLIDWPGEIPKYFSVIGQPRSQTPVAAAAYVISFIPALGLWALGLLIPTRLYTNETRASDLRFVAVFLLFVGCLTAWFYAWKGLIALITLERYLLFWLLPFIGTALAATIILVLSSFRGAARILLIIFVSILSVGSINKYPLEDFPDIRDPKAQRIKQMGPALEHLRTRVPPGMKIALKRGEKQEWGDIVSLLALMNRQDQRFLCVEPASWHLLFNEKYRCGPSDKISETLYFTDKASISGEAILELPESWVMPLQVPKIGLSIKAGEMRPFLAEGWSRPRAWGTWSVGSRAFLVFDATALPSRFSLAITARLSPAVQSVRISDEAGQTLSVVSADQLAGPVLLNIDRSNSQERNYVSLIFEINTKKIPADPNANWESQQLGIGLESLTF